MFYTLPTPQQAAAAGFEVSDYERDPVEVWPDCWPVFRTFERVCTQWLTGPAGPVALNQLAVYPLLDRMHPDAPDDWLAALDDIRDMAAAALLQLRDNQQ